MAAAVEAHREDRSWLQRKLPDYLAELDSSLKPVIRVLDENGKDLCADESPADGPDYSAGDLLNWASQLENRQQIFVSSETVLGQYPLRPSPGSRFLLVTPLYRLSSDPTKPATDEVWCGALVMEVELQNMLTQHL